MHISKGRIYFLGQLPQTWDLKQQNFPLITLEVRSLKIKKKSYLFYAKKQQQQQQQQQKKQSVSRVDSVQTLWGRTWSMVAAEVVADPGL